MTQKLRDKGWNIQNTLSFLGIISILFGGVFTYATSQANLSHLKEDVIEESKERKEVDGAILTELKSMKKRCDEDHTDKEVMSEALRNMSEDMKESNENIKEMRRLFEKLMEKD